MSGEPRQAQIGLVLAVLGLVYVAKATLLPGRVLGTQPPVFRAGATLAAAAIHPSAVAVWVRDGAS